mmetsp:Transcript_74678/g.150259  ORF Transcript_74678/g.150259 Transcript_74678/m.150259 type:complete len:203 (-) Transcript_74678:442-1050(-)
MEFMGRATTTTKARLRWEAAEVWMEERRPSSSLVPFSRRRTRPTKQSKPRLVPSKLRSARFEQGSAKRRVWWGSGSGLSLSCRPAWSGLEVCWPRRMLRGSLTGPTWRKGVRRRKKGFAGCATFSPTPCWPRVKKVVVVVGYCWRGRRWTAWGAKSRPQKASSPTGGSGSSSRRRRRGPRLSCAEPPSPEPRTQKTPPPCWV